MKRLITSLSLLVVAGLLAGCEQQQRANTATVSDLTKPLSASPTPTVTLPPSVDTRRTDLDRVVLGTVAPDFALEDMNKKIVRLSEFRGKQFVVLVFYRGHF
jgi:cytochrome oxidase Cu insertion factor (SCO1/SenC/PrrC family)